MQHWGGTGGLNHSAGTPFVEQTVVGFLLFPLSCLQVFLDNESHSVDPFLNLPSTFNNPLGGGSYSSHTSRAHTPP